MLSAIRYKNFKVLRSATLPLGRMTLIVGPNGSGKSTALEPFRYLPHGHAHEQVLTAGQPVQSAVEMMFTWDDACPGWSTRITWTGNSRDLRNLPTSQSDRAHEPDVTRLTAFRKYALDPTRIVSPATLMPKVELGTDGTGLAVVLDRLRDEEPERFEALNATLHRWLPEFDRVLFETPGQGSRGFLLRTAKEGFPIRAMDLSQGTALALAILTLAYIPSPPPILAFEEPDRGIHPRLMRDVQDALYRLAYPEQCGEDRLPVQVIATTHSPYLLDLFRDHPEEVVIANKHDDGTATFDRLSDRPDLDEILGDTQLGDAWYTGVLGGVPASR